MNLKIIEIGQRHHVYDSDHEEFITDFSGNRTLKTHFCGTKEACEQYIKDAMEQRKNDLLRN